MRNTLLVDWNEVMILSNTLSVVKYTFVILSYMLSPGHWNVLIKGGLIVSVLVGVNNLLCVWPFHTIERIIPTASHYLF